MIDEKKLIETIVNEPSNVKCYLPEFLDGMATRQNEIIDIIQRQPKTDWIPYEIDMPKELGRYIVTLKDGRSLEAIYDNISKRFIMYEHEVIAWQPLPAPYKKEGTE